MNLHFVILFIIAPLASAQLNVGFYGSSCPQAESIVRRVIAEHFMADPSITAAFLRLYFHDCFPNGCDASLLIDSSSTESSEKEAGPNRSVRGFEIIEEAKSELETQCPSTVSCADVIALATRDAIALAGGPSYEVPTGRRDGRVSNQDDANNLPGPDTPIPEALEMFGKKRFTPEDMVVLLGGHTVGSVHCFFIQPDERLMDRQLHANLSQVCTPGNRDATTFLDQSTPFVVDNKFYSEILAQRGLLTMDRQLALDTTTAPIVQSLASKPVEFLTKFASALVKLGNLDVLVGSDGEIRNKCNTFNRNRSFVKSQPSIDHPTNVLQ